MTFFTVGYGGRGFEDFLGLLKAGQVSWLVDVRRFPRSKYAAFNRDALSVALAAAGIGYSWLGEALGGFRGNYERHMTTQAYQEGIRQLLAIRGRGNIAVMCKERNESGCHRRFIAQSLKEQGQEVVSL